MDAVNTVRADGSAMNANSPMEIFPCMIDNDISELLAFESIRFGMQLGKDTNQLHIKKCVNFSEYVCISQLPRRRVYWSSATRQPRVADCMTTNRFEVILSLLYITITI